MRSLLFVPGDSERKITKAMASGADALILDLEDSVGLERKPLARTMTRDFVTSAMKLAERPRLYIRINSLDTRHWDADVAEAIAAAPDGVVLPKARSGADVHQLSVALGHAEERAGLVQGRTRIVTIATEVPISLLNMGSYVGSSSRLEGLAWGAEDLSAELGARATREDDGRLVTPFQLARDLCLMTAVAAGAQPLDTVFVNFRDRAGLERECAAAARDGFTGKMAIHPDQIEIINARFTPSEAEITASRRIVALFEAQLGAGVVSDGGEMFDRPHLTRAQRILARVGKDSRP